MQIIKEFDEEVPEAMMVVKLKRADAQRRCNVIPILLQQSESPKSAVQALAQKQSNAIYFPIDARIIPEPRTRFFNSFRTKIALGKMKNLLQNKILMLNSRPLIPHYRFMNCNIHKQLI